MMRIWRWPLLLALLSAGGLGAGLVSDGIGDVLAWIGLGIPVAVGGRLALRHQDHGRARSGDRDRGSRPG